MGQKMGHGICGREGCMYRCIAVAVDGRSLLSCSCTDIGPVISCPLIPVWLFATRRFYCTCHTTDMFLRWVCVQLWLPLLANCPVLSRLQLFVVCDSPVVVYNCPVLFVAGNCLVLSAVYNCLALSVACNCPVLSAVYNCSVLSVVCDCPVLSVVGNCLVLSAVCNCLVLSVVCNCLVLSVVCNCLVLHVRG